MAFKARDLHVELDPTLPRDVIIVRGRQTSVLFNLTSGKITTMKTYTVSYQIGTYAGTIEVSADENDDTDVVIARAKAKVNRLYGPMPSGPVYESWQVLR